MGDGQMAHQGRDDQPGRGHDPAGQHQGRPAAAGQRQCGGRHEGHARGHPVRRQSGPAGGQQQQGACGQAGSGQAGLGHARFEEEPGRVGGEIEDPGHKEHYRNHRDDRRVQRPVWATAPEREHPNAHGHDGDQPEQRHEGRHDGDEQRHRPGGPARPPAGPGEHPAGQYTDRRQEDEQNGRAQAARGDRADAHRQQRVGQGGHDPGWHEPGHLPGGQEGRDTRERDAAEQDQVHRQPRLATQQGRQDRDDRHVGRCVRGGPDAHRVEPLQVLPPQAGGTAPGGDERTATQGRAAQQ